jgi:hypothetical protein
MNNRSGEVFIIDSNILIEPYRTYYAFDFVPGFWSFMEQHFLSKKIMLLDMVYGEIAVGSDALSEWIKNIHDLEKVDHKEHDIFASYADILNFIQTSGFYKTEALADWSAATVADPFLIAAAIANQYTVITAERPVGGLNKATPLSRVKIPDICNRFSVKWGDIFYMLRQLGFRTNN